jgi:hypothetical protein
MKRFLTSAAAAAVLVAGTGSGAQAQEMRANLFELSLGAGGAYHANWLHELPAVPGTDVDGTLNPGLSAIFTGGATFWASPMIGIRTHLAYAPIKLPDGSAPDDVNGWFYDLNLMLRPWFENDDMGNIMRSMYFFLGGGGFTANPPGQGLACVSPYRNLPNAGACLPVDWEKATVGQGTAGLGFDIMSLASNIGAFIELGAYGYDSPFHTGPVWTGQPDNEVDAFGLTGRLTAGLKFGFGELAPAVVPPPVIPPPTPAPVTPPPPVAPTTRTITICVVENGMLREVSATFTPSTGDTTVNNQAFRTAFPTTAPTYASGATWYINNDSITVADDEYVRFGVARVITPPSQLTRVGEFQGTPIFAQTGEESPQEVLYVPLRPGCEFQPYQLREEIRVKG